MVSLFAEYCGRGNELLHIRDMFFPNTYISLQPTHPNSYEYMRGVWFLFRSPSHRSMGNYGRLVYLWSTVGGIKKIWTYNKHYLDDIIAFLYSLFLYTRIHGYSQKCMKTSASCGVELSPLNLNYEVQWSLCTYTSLAHNSTISKKYVRNLPLFCSLCMGKIFMPQTNFTTRHLLRCYHLDDIISFIF